MRNLTNWLLLCVIVLLAFVVFQHRKAQKIQGRTRRFSLINGSVLVFDNKNGMLCSAVTQEALAEDLQTVQSSLKNPTNRLPRNPDRMQSSSQRS